MGILESFGNKRMPWYLCYPFVSIKFTSLAAVIVGVGVKIVMMEALFFYEKRIFSPNTSEIYSLIRVPTRDV